MDNTEIEVPVEGLLKIAEENKLVANSHLLDKKGDDSSINLSEIIPLNNVDYVVSNNVDTGGEVAQDFASLDATARAQDPEHTISHDIVSALRSMMDDEIYESGVSAPSENYFKSEFRKNKLLALNSLNCFFLDNYKPGNTNEHYLVGCLHMISHMEYAEVYPIGQTIALVAINFKDSTEVQEYGIKCFEDWGNADGVDKLSATNFSTKWLKEYASDVIDELKKENKWDIMSERFLDQSGRTSHAI